MTDAARTALYEACKDDPTVLAFLQMEARSKDYTEEAMLEDLVLRLISEKAQLREQVIDLIQRTGAEPKIVV